MSAIQLQVEEGGGHVLEAVHVGEQPEVSTTSILVFIWKADLLHYIQVGGVDQDPAETQLLCRGALHLPVRHHEHVGGEAHRYLKHLSTN